MRLIFNIELVTKTGKRKRNQRIIITLNVELVTKREKRPFQTTYRQSFGSGCMTPNLAALRSTPAASSNGRRCCSGPRCSFGCAFRCFFPPLRVSRAAGALFGICVFAQHFRAESSMASEADCCSTPPSSNLLNSSSFASAG